jgi:hypothetical protein
MRITRLDTLFSAQYVNGYSTRTTLTLGLVLLIVN